MDVTNVNLELNIDLFVCPLSHEIFNDPVIAEDGHLYERSAIDEWLLTNKSSPITREPIGSRLVESYTIKNIIEVMFKQNPTMIEQQFKLDNLYSKNTTKIHSFIQNGQFDKLLGYTKYNLEILIKNDLFSNILNRASTKVIKYVIDNSIDLDCTNLLGKKPVHYVSICKNNEIMRYMFDKGVNLEAKDESDWRPIHHICYNSNQEMIRYLLEKNVSLDCKTRYGWLPIHAICNYSSVEMIRLFIKTGIGLNAKISIYNGSSANYGCADLIKLNSKLKESEKVELLKLLRPSVVMNGLMFDSNEISNISSMMAKLVYSNELKMNISKK
jgi:ankyrin repeat protein